MGQQEDRLCSPGPDLTSSVILDEVLNPLNRLLHKLDDDSTSQASGREGEQGPLLVKAPPGMCGTVWTCNEGCVYCFPLLSEKGW